MALGAPVDKQQLVPHGHDVPHQDARSFRLAFGPLKRYRYKTIPPEDCGLSGPPGPRPRGFSFPPATMRISFLVDGFNLYHSLRAAEKSTCLRPLKWLDLHRLCTTLVSSGFGPGAQLEGVYYFSALAHHLKRLDVIRRHKTLLEVLRDSGVEISLSRFKKKSTRASLTRCHFFVPGHRWRLRLPMNRVFVSVRGFEEKETDVAIAVKMLELAHSGRTDCLVLMSGDTDLCAAVDGVRRMFPSVGIRVAFPYERYNRDLDRRVDGRFRLSPRLMATNQFPDPYVLKSGRAVSKPREW